MVDTTRVAMALTMAMTRLQARMRLESAAPIRTWTWSQLSMMCRVIERGPLTAAALAQVEHVRPQVIAETIAALRADGLVVTGPDPNDRRRLLVSATSRGREVAGSVIAEREKWLVRALDKVTTSDERQLLAEATVVLNKLADASVPEGEDASPARDPTRR
jgi:DNA-binding MarR family transcriptional regulator